MLRYGEIKVYVPEDYTEVHSVYAEYIPCGLLRSDNRRRILVKVKTASGKVLCKDYENQQNWMPFDFGMRVKRIIQKPEEWIIVV